MKIETLRGGKYKVCPEVGADFVLYRKELATYGLTEEEELSPEVWQQILNDVLIPRAKKRAMHLLEQQDRSVFQLERKLTEGGYPSEAVRAALDYVASFHYTDDERLAANYVRSQAESRSRLRIRQDLVRRGISEEIIDAALEAEYPDSERPLIESLLKKKGYDRDTATEQDKARMVRFLGQRGFVLSDIYSALR